MNKNFTEIYKNQNNYKVCACLLGDKSTKRIEIGIVIVDPVGGMTEVIKIKKSKIGNNTFNFLLDYEGDFGKDDINNIKRKLQISYSKLKLIDNSTKSGLNKILYELCKYVHDHQGKNDISITAGYCNIPSDIFDGVVKGIDDGYTGLEVKKDFKIKLDILQVNSGRPYDYAMTNKEGVQYRVIRFKDIKSTVDDSYGGVINGN